MVVFLSIEEFKKHVFVLFNISVIFFEFLIDFLLCFERFSFVCSFAILFFMLSTIVEFVFLHSYHFVLSLTGCSFFVVQFSGFNFRAI